MTKETNIKLFEEKKVRTIWDEEKEEWYFSVVDVVEILTDSPRPRKYWNALKMKLRAEGSEVSHNLGQLKLLSDDNKMRLTDVANTEQILRLIQSIPSKKAEPFKLWLAKVGAERIDETVDTGATVAKVARKQIEKSTGKSAVSSLNAKSSIALVKGK